MFTALRPPAGGTSTIVANSDQHPNAWLEAPLPTNRIVAREISTLAWKIRPGQPTAIRQLQIAEAVEAACAHVELNFKPTANLLVWLNAEPRHPSPDARTYHRAPP